MQMALSLDRHIVVLWLLASTYADGPQGQRPGAMPGRDSHHPSRGQRPGGMWGGDNHSSSEGPPSSCTEINLTSSTQVTFQSPGSYPYRYHNHLDTCWLITSTEASYPPAVLVTFSAIESLLFTSCNMADFIEVHDGSDMNSTLLLRWCGWGYPRTPFVSSGQHLYIYFHTDHNVNYGGFEMKAYLKTSLSNGTEANPNPTFPPVGILPDMGIRPPPGGRERHLGRRPSTTPRTTTMALRGGSRKFQNDRESLLNFNRFAHNTLRPDLGRLSDGAIAGVVIAVLTCVILIGVLVHFSTKSWVNKHKPRSRGWDSLSETGHPPRHHGDQPQRQDNDSEGATGGSDLPRTSQKYNLPGPVVTVATMAMPPPVPIHDLSNDFCFENHGMGNAMNGHGGILTGVAETSSNHLDDVAGHDQDGVSVEQRRVRPARPLPSLNYHGSLPPLEPGLSDPLFQPAGGLPPAPPAYSGFTPVNPNASMVSLPPPYEESGP